MRLYIKENNQKIGLNFLMVEVMLYVKKKGERINPIVCGF